MFIVTFALIGANSFWSGVPSDEANDDGNIGPPDSPAFGIARAIVIVFLLSWIAMGIRQWFVLSKWTQRYEIYKELQEKINQELDYERRENTEAEEKEKEKEKKKEKNSEFG